MIHRQFNYYSSFRCLGGSCPDTCCRDWDIVLDQETLLDYHNAPPSLSAQLQASLTTDQEGDTCFRLDRRGFCTMLTPQGLCAIQKEWGESHLCRHCAAYPRFIEEYGSLTEASLALSCPQAARLLLESPAIRLEETDDGQSDQPFPDIPPQLLAELELSRKKALNTLAQCGYTVWERMRGILTMAQTVQQAVGAQDDTPVKYPDVCLEALLPTAQSKDFSVSLCRFFAALEPLRLSWPQRLKGCFQALEGLSQESYRELCLQFHRGFPRWDEHLTRLAGYLLFRHWHKAVNDDQLYGRAAFVACGITLLYHLFAVAWHQHGALTPEEEIAICCAFSREVEHMEENLALAVDTFATLSPASIHFPNV